LPFYKKSINNQSGILASGGVALVENQTSVGLTSDLQGRKLFGPKSEIISDQRLQERVGRKSI
jgi:hypothetical protein